MSLCRRRAGAAASAPSRRAVALAVMLAGAASCNGPYAARPIDPSLIEISSELTMRTDTVGEGQHASLASFVLVEAQNRAEEPAVVSLSGTFVDERGEALGALRAESLWVPAGGRRLFALVDKARAPRPQAKGARLVVSGAKVQDGPPVMRIVGEESFDDFGKLVVRGTLVNDAARPGRAMVLAGFFDAKGKPMTRPFVLVPIAAKSQLPVHLVGPVGSRRGALFLGDLVY